MCVVRPRPSKSERGFGGVIDSVGADITHRCCVAGARYSSHLHAQAQASHQQRSGVSGYTAAVHGNIGFQFHDFIVRGGGLCWCNGGPEVECGAVA